MSSGPSDATRIQRMMSWCHQYLQIHPGTTAEDLLDRFNRDVPAETVLDDLTRHTVIERVLEQYRAIPNNPRTNIHYKQPEKD